MWLVVALSCGADGETSTGHCRERAWLLDQDGDLFGGSSSVVSCEAPEGYVATGGDCDDSAAEVNPDAVEVCDGIDRDCDGHAPEVVWYLDEDGDGFGVEEHAQASCEQPGGYAGEFGDCDDESATTWPGAPDNWYDGVDSDCAGDDDFDADRDGSPVDEDCDDSDPRRSPDNPEQCGTGVDEDCSGVADDCQFFGGVAGAEPALEIWGTLSKSGSDRHSTAGLWIWSLPGFGDAHGPSFSVFGYTESTAEPDQHLFGAGQTGRVDLWAADAHFSGQGYSAGVFAVGDVHGDGVDHMARPLQTERAILLYPFGAAGLVGTEEAGTRIDATASMSGFSSGLADVLGADLNGDGVTDLVVTADLASAGWAEPSVGVVYILNGPISSGLELSSDANVAIRGSQHGDAPGELMASGDVDGDGLDDLAIAGLRSNTNGVFVSLAYGPVSGAAWVDYEGFGVDGNDPDETLSPLVDADQDGFLDVLVSGSGFMEVRSGPTWTREPLASVTEPEVRRCDWGDINGDDTIDLACGFIDSTQVGEVRVYLGPVEGGIAAEDADGVLVGTQEAYNTCSDPDLAYCWHEAERFGYAVRFVGDWDGDGTDDVVVGAPWRESAVGEHGPGAALLYLGAPGSPW